MNTPRSAGESKDTSEKTPTTKGYGQRLPDAPMPAVKTAVVTYTPRFSGKDGKKAADNFIDLLKKGKIPFVRLGADGELRIQTDIKKDERGKIIKKTYRVKQDGVENKEIKLNINIENTGTELDESHLNPVINLRVKYIFLKVSKTKNTRQKKQMEELAMSLFSKYKKLRDAKFGEMDDGFDVEFDDDPNEEKSAKQQIDELMEKIKGLLPGVDAEYAATLPDRMAEIVKATSDMTVGGGKLRF